MDRSMQAVEVYVGKDGHVVISQEQFCQEAARVILHPSQVPVIVEWLQEAALEARRMALQQRRVGTN